MEDNKGSFLNRIFSKQNSFFNSTPQKMEAKTPRSEVVSSPLFTISYDGEKNLGEIGPIIDYKPNYEALRLRSWQSYYESEIAQTVINKFKTWIIGSGLKLQADPVKVVLKSEKIEIDSEEFNKTVEARFRVFSNSKCCHYGEMQNLHFAASEALLNSIVGGDVLVVLRYIDGEVKYQLIDGAHVVSPLNMTEFNTTAKKGGNKIRNGIEISPKGQHVAYYVRKPGILFDVERIPARGDEYNQVMAYMVYGLKYRMDTHRGVPLIAVVMETIKKLERYKEATVGSAEERQKIAFSIEHTRDSTGENPLAKNLAKIYDIDKNNRQDVPVTIEGKKLADIVAASTNKQAWNMPIGSSLKMLESKNELYFKDFYSVNIDLICAAVGIPPEVAQSKYDSNFSSARAAIKDWENTINVNRKYFSEQFYQPFYNLWLLTEILKNKVQAPGYLKAFAGKDNMTIGAYQSARWLGVGVPHIDPLKEVKAEREKLGALGVNLPLTTLEAATESLNGGESDSNMHQFSEELKLSEELDLVAPEPPATGTGDSGDAADSGDGVDGEDVKKVVKKPGKKK